jgi:hypothetical protein
MAPFIDVDFNNRVSALIAVGTALGVGAANMPSQSCENSNRTYLKFINLMRVEQSLPPLPDMDYTAFVPALNVLAARVP